MKQRILVLGGSRQAEEGLKHLAAMGLELVVCDFDLRAPGFRHATHQILASVYHIEECLPAVEAFHTKHPIDGVMCLACDVPHIVARIAKSLGLPGISLAAADRAIDKLAMKQQFEADGIAIPNYWAVLSAKEIKDIQRTQYPELVVKPVDSRGSKGVSRLKEGGDAAWAYDYALANSPTGQVMVEEYIAGPQVSTESIIIDGQAVTPALSDRSYEFLEKYYPYIVENGGDMPSALPAAVTERIKTLVEQAAASLGVTNGIVKGDIVVRDSRPYVIELAARLSGGYYCTHQIPFSTGINLVEACARMALGEKLDPANWQAQKHTHVSTRWKLVEPGFVEKVPDTTAPQSSIGVLAFEHWLNEGDEISVAKNAAASVAMVQAEGNSQLEARARAVAALEKFQPVIIPIDPTS